MSNVKKNIFYNMGYQILILIVPFITSPYVSRVLGPEGVGTYSVTTSIVKYFSMFAALGMSNYGNRLISKARDNKKNLSVTFCNLFYFQMLTSGFCIALYVLYYVFIGQESYGLVSLCQTPYIAAAFFEISWFFYGLENFKFMVVRNAVVKVATTVCIFIFVKNASDVWIYVLINALSLLVGQLCMWPFLLKEIKWTAPHWDIIKQHFKPNMILFVSVVAVSVYTLMDKIMIEWMSNTSEVGYYENGEKLFNLGCNLVGSIGAVMLPRMTYLMEKKDIANVSSVLNKSMKYMVAFSLALSFGLIGISDQFCVIFFGKEFAQSGVVLAVLSIAIVFYAWENILRTEYLLPSGRDKIFVIGTMIAAVVNLFLNSILIPSFGAVGAAVGTVAAQIAEASYQSFSVRRELPVLNYIGGTIPFFIISLIMCICCKIIGNVFGISFFVVICQIIFGGVVFCLFSVIVLVRQQDPFLLDIRNHIKKHFKRNH